MTIDDIKDPLIKSRFETFKRHPTERNACFLSGYLTALHERQYINGDYRKALNQLIDELEG